jgi:hypothetical protein
MDDDSPKVVIIVDVLLLEFSMAIVSLSAHLYNINRSLCIRRVMKAMAVLA